MKNYSSYMYYSKNLFFKVSVYCIPAINFLNIVIDLLRARGQLNKTFTNAIYKCNFQVSVAIVLRWCYTGPFATTSFSATQRCNVGAMLWSFETAQCRNNVATLFCAKSRRCESSLVTPLDRGTQQEFSEEYLFGRRFEI